MKKKLLIILAMLCIPVTPLLSAAGDFDGSKPFLCTVTEATECIIGEGCRDVTAEEINLPRIFVDQRWQKNDSRQENPRCTPEKQDRACQGGGQQADHSGCGAGI